MPADRDYLLGTHDDELARLGLQHQVWRHAVLDCWRRADVKAGVRVLDVGAGPGFAAADLGELVGPSGAVVAVERSGRFVQAGRQYCSSRGLSNVLFHEIDLMTEPIPESGFDVSWCRWVACFVASPAVLVQKLAAALRPGGVAVFHEYWNYASWRYAPPRPLAEEFVREVMTNWRASGGEPDIGLAMPSLLVATGFRLREARPIIFCLRPGDPMWQWPASFVNVHLDRLLELGRVEVSWINAVRREFQAAEADPHTLATTPMVMEIIAERV